MTSEANSVLYAMRRSADAHKQFDTMIRAAKTMDQVESLVEIFRDISEDLNVAIAEYEVSLIDGPRQYEDDPMTMAKAEMENEEAS